MIYCETEIDGKEFYITATMVGGGPANLTGHPDTWSPGEPTEIEIINVRSVRDGEESDIDFDALDEKQKEKIFQAVLDTRE